MDGCSLSLISILDGREDQGMSAVVFREVFCVILCVSGRVVVNFCRTRGVQGEKKSGGSQSRSFCRVVSGILRSGRRM